MEGYEVVANDGQKIGTVSAVVGDYLIVEHGLLRKHKNVLPMAMVHTTEGENVVHATVAKGIVEDAPECTDPEKIDRAAVAAYYGLAEDMEAPDTQGYGDVIPGDPGRSSAAEAERHGVTTAEEERARVREDMRPESAEADTRDYGVGTERRP